MSARTPKSGKVLPTPGHRDRVLERLRKICANYPASTEAASFGNPAFKAGKKPYVVLDRYKGVDCIYVYVEAGLRDALLHTAHFFAAPYDPKGKAICRTLDKIDWRELESLIHGSYCAVALKRMRDALSRPGR